MVSTAFCPAHVTGFFKAYLEKDNQKNPEKIGSMGAGFSIREGVTTHINILPKINQNSNFKITTIGYESDKTDVSEFVLIKFLKLGNFEDKFFDSNNLVTIFPPRPLI
jgi:pantoate kinase